MKRYLHIFLATLLLGISLLSCTGNEPQRPVLAVSIEPQRFLLEQIAGDKIDIVCLLQEGVNPENYEPSMSNMMALERSNAYLTIGQIGFEAALLERIKASRPELKVISSSKGIALTAEGEQHPHGDPHVWTSVANARVIAGNMLQTLLAIDPANKDYYQLRHKHLLNRLDTLDRDIHKLIDPIKGSSFLIWHPSLTYFAHEYNLTQLPLEPAAKETTPQIIAQRVEQARQAKPRLIFYQKEFDARVVTTIGQETGLPIVEINPMAYRWDKQMLHIAQALANP